MYDGAFIYPWSKVGFFPLQWTGEMPTSSLTWRARRKRLQHPSRCQIASSYTNDDDLTFLTLREGDPSAKELVFFGTSDRVLIETSEESTQRVLWGNVRIRISSAPVSWTQCTDNSRTSEVFGATHRSCGEEDDRRSSEVRKWASVERSSVASPVVSPSTRSYHWVEVIIV